LFIVSSQAIDPTKEPLKNIILSGIEMTINNQYTNAIELYRGLIHKYPEHPIGYFYVGASIQAKMLDAEDFTEKDEFYRLMDHTIFLADSLQTKTMDDAWILFYEGFSFLYRSFMKSKEGRWFPAYRDALKGVRHLEESIKIDSTMYDAYFGVGSFKYWKSARTNFLLWLPLIKDEREKGIQMIKTAIDKGQFVRLIAKDQLAWILMNAGEKQEALKISLENIQKFPDSRFFKWTLVEAAMSNKNYKLSAQIYTELLDSISILPDNNYYNELECLVSLAEIEAINKNWELANQFADKALRLEINSNVRKRAKNKLKRALKIRNLAQKSLQ
jgi:tetratricopeptide (TPR) repeat protein